MPQGRSLGNWETFSVLESRYSRMGAGLGENENKNETGAHRHPFAVVFLLGKKSGFGWTGFLGGVRPCVGVTAVVAH